MNKVTLFVLIVGGLLGCDLSKDERETLLCTYLPYSLGDCQEPEIKERFDNIMTNGVVDAQLSCRGVAFNGARFVQVDYVATRFLDGTCDARVTLAGPDPGGTGFIHSTGSSLTHRTNGSVGSCPAISYHVPMLQSVTYVENGVLNVESTFCTNPGQGVTCSMPLSNCSGLNPETFQ